MTKMGLTSPSPAPPLQPLQVRDDQRGDYQNPVGEAASGVYPVGLKVRFVHNKCVTDDLPFLKYSRPIANSSFVAPPLPARGLRRRRRLGMM
jgi:hypothetical protein